MLLPRTPLFGCGFFGSASDSKSQKLLCSHLVVDFLLRFCKVAWAILDGF
jgi:hypothetical protein